MRLDHGDGTLQARRYCSLSEDVGYERHEQGNVYILEGFKITVRSNRGTEELQYHKCPLSMLLAWRRRSVSGCE